MCTIGGDFDRHYLDMKNAYELMATPSVPLNINDLHDEILSTYLLNLKIRQVEFKDNKLVNVKDYLDCVYL